MRLARDEQAQARLRVNSGRIEGRWFSSKREKSRMEGSSVAIADKQEPETRMVVVRDDELPEEPSIIVINSAKMAVPGSNPGGLLSLR